MRGLDDDEVVRDAEDESEHEEVEEQESTGRCPSMPGPADSGWTRAARRMGSTGTCG